ncbi:MAG: magnesium/cobalt transporter CorA [Anaerolineae bacterium]
MIHSIFYPKDGSPRSNLSLAQIAQALHEPDGLLWVSLEPLTDEEAGSILRDIFQFHPLAIEDCQSAGYQAPKVDDFGAYLFIIVHALRPNLPLDELDTMEINCFLAHNYLVTSCLAPEAPPLQAVRRRLERDERLFSRGASFLCHAILDQVVDEYMPIIEVVDEEIEGLEDEILAQPTSHTLERILDLKHSTLTLRRIIIPQREVMNRLSRDDLPQISPQHRIYYRDVYDHLVRIHDLSESVRDVIIGMLDTYLSVTSNRLNEVMKTLTIVSTIFLPLSFIAAVYGMNFEYMPELHWRYGYLMAWAIFLIVPLAMILFFKRKGWF